MSAVDDASDREDIVVALGNVNDIATFVAVAKAGSFIAAAQQIGITRSAVGKIIARLEERLQVRLLHRTPRSLALTDDGAVFLARCASILEDLEEIELAMAARSATPTGELRISVPIALGHRQVCSVIESYLAKWPAVTADVSFTDRYVDLVDEGIDIAIRIGEPKSDSRIISRTVATQSLLVCAAPAYLREKGVPTDPSELVDHECLHFVNAGRPEAWRFRNDGEASIQMKGRLRTDSAEALVAAAVSGAGIIRVPTYLVAAEIREGRLQPLLERFSVDGTPIRVIYPTRRHLTPKVRVFIDQLIAAWQPVPPWELKIS